MDSQLHAPASYAVGDPGLVCWSEDESGGVDASLEEAGAAFGAAVQEETHSNGQGRALAQSADALSSDARLSDAPGRTFHSPTTLPTSSQSAEALRLASADPSQPSSSAQSEASVSPLLDAAIEPAPVVVIPLVHDQSPDVPPSNVEVLAAQVMDVQDVDRSQTMGIGDLIFSAPAIFDGVAKDDLHRIATCP